MWAVTCRLRHLAILVGEVQLAQWKCVAKRAEQRISLTMCSEMAQARPKPSYVDVPRPSSSMMIRLSAVADLRMLAVSEHLGHEG